MCSLPLAIGGFVEAILLITSQEIGHRGTPEPPIMIRRGWRVHCRGSTLRLKIEVSLERNGGIEMIHCLAAGLLGTDGTAERTYTRCRTRRMCCFLITTFMEISVIMKKLRALQRKVC